MVEQAHTRKAHDHAVTVTSLNDVIVTNGAAGLCHVGHAALSCPLNIIPEGEEGVASHRNARNGGKIFLFFLCRKRLGSRGKVILSLRT